MATYDTDEEQIEALKRWWDENGNSVLVGIAIIALSIFSWRHWQSSQVVKAEEASEIYMEIVDIVSGNPVEGYSEEEISTARFLNEQLRNDYASVIYAKYAALMMARLYVEEDDLASAEAELSWVVDNPALGFMQSMDDSLLLTARLRLARVVLAQDDAQRALDLLNAVEAGEYAVNYAEVKGDIYMALGDTENARQAYESALSSGGTNSLAVELKLRDLGSI